MELSYRSVGCTGGLEITTTLQRRNIKLYAPKTPLVC